MSKKSTIWDVIIIGGGASGLMAAVTAAREGSSVLVIEQRNRPGKKILATGNGKCNYTNSTMDPSCYHGDESLIRHIFESFTHADTVSFFQELGVYPKEKNGYFYPNSEQAVSVLRALEQELHRQKVTLVTEACLCRIFEDKYGFWCETSQNRYHGRKVILATGLLASPKLGSDGSAIPVIKELGHRFERILPALVGFYASGMPFSKVHGVRCDTSITLRIDGTQAGAERGELQFTDYGVSGIPVFQLSSVAARARAEKHEVTMHLNLLPDFSVDALYLELTRRRSFFADTRDPSLLLSGLLNDKLIPVCLQKAGITAGAAVSDSQLTRLTDILLAYPVTLDKVREVEYAQVCSGGIRTDEIDSATLESRLVPGIYFAGELLNVDGICGGYNLQWAWTSGYVSALSACRQR